MFKIGTRTIPLDTPFTHNDIQYPANWIRLATEEDKAAIGLVWEADPVRADDRFYWDGNINNPKDLDGLKSNFISQVKATAGTILAQTDWMVIRKAERNVDIPSSVATYRASVVAKANELETAISAVTTVEQLASLDLSFPKDE
jgi:hypothetical protein